MNIPNKHTEIQATIVVFIKAVKKEKKIAQNWIFIKIPHMNILLNCGY